MLSLCNILLLLLLLLLLQFCVHPTQVNALLPAQIFIDVIAHLLGNKLPTIRRKAMELLNSKLLQHQDYFKEQVSVSSNQSECVFICSSFADALYATGVFHKCLLFLIFE